VEDRLKSVLEPLLVKLIRGRYVIINKTNVKYEIEYVDIDIVFSNVISSLELIFSEETKTNILSILQYCENKILNIGISEFISHPDDIRFEWQRLVGYQDGYGYENELNTISENDENKICNHVHNSKEKIVSEFDKFKNRILSNLSESIKKEGISVLEDFKFEWAGDGTADKYEISELIQALYLSKRIRFDGKPISQKRLIDLFNILFPAEKLTSNGIATNLKKGYSVRTGKESSKPNQFYLDSITPLFIEYMQKEFRKDQDSKKD
jgi:hypothetical protein